MGGTVTGPAVSVCIPTYNGEAYVKATINSVLRQTWQDFEVIVSDDGSSDRTLDVVASVDDGRVRLARERGNVGPAANWDRAIAYARGQYVKLLCQDDLLYPRCLERQVEAFETYDAERLAFVASQRDIIDGSGRVVLHGRGLAGMRGRLSGEEAVRRVVRSGANPFGEPSAVLFRSGLVDRVGGFDARRRYVIDLDYWCRLLGVGDVYALGERLGAFRVTGGSWSVSLSRTQGAETRALFRDVVEWYPEWVSRGDYLVGSLKAGGLRRARGLVYRWLAKGSRVEARNRSEWLKVARSRSRGWGSRRGDPGEASGEGSGKGA